MKLEENDKFLDYQDIESQLFQKGNYGHTGGLRSRSSIILSQEPSRSIFHSRLTPKAEEAEVRFHVGDHEDQDEDRSVLFTQLNELVPVNDGVLWKESARWVRFEEKTEDGGERWSKPHVTTLSLHSLFELRTCFERGIISLDVENNTFKEIVENILKLKICTDRTTEEENENILYTLLQGHVHHIKKSYRNRIKDAIKLNKGKKTSPKNTLLELPEKPSSEQLKNKFRKKIPVGTEVANILVGEVDYLNQPFAAFIRLKDADVLGTLTEVALPTRFIFILLGPSGNAKACHEIGRAIATLLTDELFRKISYKAMNRDELISGIDDFLDEVAVLPPGRWDPTVRIQPPKFLPSVHRRQAILQRESKNHCNGKLNETEKLAHGHPHVSEELLKTTKFFGGLIKDIRRKAPWYWSDFYDALNLQCLSAILFIYLATVTNSITFGGMLGDATDNMQGVLENFIGTAICGGFFCIFSGQPLTILSSTGPVLVFERLLYSFSKDYNFEYLEFRLWIGLWVAFYCLILVATNAAYLVQYFTRFTEESFCALISCIFIYDAMKKMLNLADHFPVNWKYNIDNMTQYSCKCNLLEMGNESSSNFTLYDPFYYVNMQDPINLTRGQCIEFGGHLEGISCNYVPDVFLMSVILFLGTFLCTASLKSFQTSRYLSTSIRKLTGDFSVILTIAIFCTVDVMCGLETPKLVVPNEFKPTNPNRSWFVYPFGGNPWWVCLLSGIPAILITILLFMDQQITAVILNRKEYKLKKGAGLHLDFFCISLLIILTSFMGLPWYVSATVISLAHMNSLKMETTVSAPGEQPKFLGIREQRVTGLAVFILTGISVFLSPVLKYIPMPVLYGIFLQMGVTALRSIQFTERLKLLFIPPKHQPDVIYLRHVPLRKVHFFTLVQLSCLIILWILKSTVAAIIFPLMLLALAGIRKAMECIFSLHDLSWLDDILPEKIVTDEEPKTEDLDSTDSEDTELKYQEKAPEINISVN